MRKVGQKEFNELSVALNECSIAMRSIQRDAETGANAQEVVIGALQAGDMESADNTILAQYACLASVINRYQTVFQKFERVFYNFTGEQRNIAAGEAPYDFFKRMSELSQDEILALLPKNGIRLNLTLGS